MTYFWNFGTPSISRERFELETRDLHGDGDHGNPAESAGIPRGWELMLRGSRGNGNICRGTPAGMERTCTGFPRKCSCI